MEKRRVRLEINGVLCGVITQESDEYMNGLAEAVSELMQEIQLASPYITREAAALTVALGYCDDAKKSERKIFEMQERIDELEVEAEIWQEEEADIKGKVASFTEKLPGLQEKMKRLEQENTKLAATAEQLEELRCREASLQEENEALRHELASAAQEQDPVLLAQLEQLKQENEALARSSSEWMEELNRREKELTEENEPAADPALLEKLTALERENEELSASTEWLEELRRRETSLQEENETLQRKLAEQSEPAETAGELPAVRKYRENPLRSHLEDEHLQSFYAAAEKET